MNKMKFKLNMATLNGIILGLIGLLVLITPLTTEITSQQLTIVVIAGAALFTGGCVSILLGLRKERH